MYCVLCMVYYVWCMETEVLKNKSNQTAYSKKLFGIFPIPNTQYPIHPQKGMTALEIVIALAIVLLVGALIAIPLARFKNNQLLVSSAEQIISALREARANTLAAKNDTVHGVHFESGRFVIFSTSWSEGAAGNTVTYFQEPVYLPTISLSGGGSDVLFTRLTGKTSQPGTLVLQLEGNASSQKTITIDASGAVSVSE